ncbi:leucine-rich repeat-containing protein 2 isoform X2 [Anoplopoma fimbria]|uniref:leucine-rich repeat-containing protein 2 isoform X2 n=1 Tax=Anoplopoma fimbria TaxID=229290 RepID=UPI0023ED1B3D|nr:leucine-rich repeat-containing protein 2 isoform X2 [Anoplopoma fimbria]
MGLGRRVEVPVSDLSLVRDLWEVRVKKHRQKEQNEKERIEQSALPKIDQQWQYRIYCKTLKTKELTLLHRYLERSTLTSAQLSTEAEQQDQKDPEQSRLIFQLDGDQWTDFPRELQWMTYLKEWHVSRTKISRLPEYLDLFTQLTVLEIPKNTIAELPPEIGKLTALRKLNVSYNRLSRVPPELGDCENLKRLELTGNHHLSDLPFELSSLKQLVHLDVAENSFASIPICALRMSGLQLLDLSNNRLTDLPQDMDRLEQLVTLFLHKNNLSYLPHCLCKISTLKMIVVNGDALTCCPTKLCRNPDIKFIRLCDKRSSAEKKKKKKKKEEEEKKKEKDKRRRWRGQREEEEEEEEEVRKDGREKEFIEAYISSLKDRDTVPESTTKLSISCLL